MTRYEIAIVALSVAALAGCEIPRPPNDYQVCNSYGLSPGRDGGFAQCMEQRQQNRMQAAQFLMNRPPSVPYTPLVVPFRGGGVTTNCVPMGGGRVNCYSN